MKPSKPLKIACYNLWNSQEFTFAWVKSIVAELRSLDADIIALQEVPKHFNEFEELATDYLADCVGYLFKTFVRYPSEDDEGLAFLAKHPIESVKSSWEGVHDIEKNQFALRVSVQVEDVRFAFTNVHLSSQPSPIIVREEQIVAVIRWIDALTTKGTHEILLGDFNCYPQSSVHRFLCGHQSLLGESTYWHDLASVYQARSEPEPTLDFSNNPRWWDSNTLELDGRFDWIMLKDAYPKPCPEVQNVCIFGKSKHYSRENSPSDHYGVCATIKW